MKSYLPSEDPEVGPDPHGAETDVKIGEADGEQAQPGEELMLVVERARARVGHVARTVLRHLVVRTTNQVPHRVTPERVGTEQNDVHGQDDRPDAYSERRPAAAIRPS